MTGRIIGIIVVVLVALGVWFLLQSGGPEVPAGGEATYSNETYGYSFSYPDSYTVNAYSPEAVSVGTARQGSFDSAVDVMVMESTDAASFDAFLEERLLVLCAADSPQESYSCTEASQSGTLTRQGERDAPIFYLTLVHTDLAGTRTEDSFGPIYAYELPSEAGYRALLVFEPLPSFIAEPDPDLVRGVAESMSF